LAIVDEKHDMNKAQPIRNDDALAEFDWKRVSRLVLLSRALDHLEESELVPAKKVFNQFSARGHDFAQILLGSLMTHPHDGASGYYRSRPFVLSIGLSPEDALAAPMAKSGGYSDGRDIGVVCNFPGNGRLGPACTLLPMSGGVGAQYTPVAGWAQGIAYHRDTLKDAEWKGAVALSMGGDASLSTNGFWSAFNSKTTAMAFRYPPRCKHPVETISPTWNPGKTSRSSMVMGPIHWSHPS
jgi:2-oxoisovalerate dehydrogenase E1 component